MYVWYRYMYVHMYMHYNRTQPGNPIQKEGIFTPNRTPAHDGVNSYNLSRQRLLTLSSNSSPSSSTFHGTGESTHLRSRKEEILFRVSKLAFSVKEGNEPALTDRHLQAQAVDYPGTNDAWELSSV